MLSSLESYLNLGDIRQWCFKCAGSGAVLEDAINNRDCCSRSSSRQQTAVVSDQSYNPSWGFKAH